MPPFFSCCGMESKVALTFPENKEMYRNHLEEDQGGIVNISSSVHTEYIDSTEDIKRKEFAQKEAD